MPCHQGDNIGPMALTTYKKVAAYGQMIRYVTQEKLMPPFRAVAPTDHFVGERRLSEKEIATIGAWVKAGMPKGEPSRGELSPLPSPPPFDTDLILSMDESFEQYGVYYDQYRVFVLPTGLTEDKWVSGISFEPGNRSIVKGVMISVDTSDKYQALDEWDPEYGYFSFGELGFVPDESRWYSWAAGQDAEILPEGKAKWLPKDARLLVHVHYGPTGIRQRDSSVVKLRWAKVPAPRPIRTAPLINPYVMTNDTFAVAAGEVYRVHAKFRVPFDLEISSLFPHAHFLGRKFEVFATLPDGRSTKLLLRIDDWDFHFKQGYELLNPILLPAGSVVHTLVTYDNTSANLANPNDPPRAMGWGKRMYKEMLLVYFSYQPVKKSSLLKPGPVNISSPQGEVELELPSNNVFDLEIVDFSGDNHRVVLKEKSFSKGNHRVVYDLKGLPFGNYVFQLKDEEGQIVGERIFLYLASDLFD
ncbi:hypothetical protein SAMN05444359_1123 [Neolewinella agarilytica]|uniref:Uncharacterized protein n=2 Tax=Neolewinella agarilytica TaxID=478744 RepID=A0A1H9H3M3_9BACT|nr:hypothetical protein SAMN05444359_1123 [Neolewinella agarilytica]